MSQSKTLSIASRGPLVPHEELDAYWFAQMLRARASRVAAEAKCNATIGRSLDSTLGRVIRLIVEAADGAPERADARLVRARAALGLVLHQFYDLPLKRQVNEPVIADLREHACLLLGRLQMLEGKPVEAWARSNELATVLDETKSGPEGDSHVDTLAAVAKLPEIAVRGLPPVIIAGDFVAHVRVIHARIASMLPSNDGAEEVVKVAPE